MDIQEIRRKVLRALINRKHNNVARQFALAIKKPEGQINDMLSTPPRKAFGERVARSIEHSYGLDVGYLDNPNNAVVERYDLPRQAPVAIEDAPCKVVYGQLNSTITEVIELMNKVDSDTQRDILGSVRMACTEYRLKTQNSTLRHGQ